MKQLIRHAMISASVLLFSAPLPAEPPSEALPAFDMLEMQVDGNSVLDQQLIEKTLYPFLGTGKTVSDVEKARQTLEAVYKNNWGQSKLKFLLNRL